MSGETTIADYYRRYRPLARPKTNIFVISKGLIFIIVLAAFVAFLVAIVCEKTIDGISYSTIGLFSRMAGLIVILMAIFCHKRIALLLIELYQHYASEKRRRKCVCMPSCSVYALMVLRKHNIIKALYLICNRLSKCCGSVAFIDYP